ncbi:magnesium-transporting ATPase (P-type) [Actinoplanes campanulatus]|uniref:Magnesium-transporting ATPase (P-type) n=1 Tax=Actinoplanes campanulatus TaxID=113559 RepID=A0A7W5AT49_9ACTN|nr:cation-transporting P-type ATPase [Actinoplanes campanulatus]MBB3101519.1 magnesium-transporting ATPase (P-type) [Actinoplanes campanulatus]GGN52010.1 hypothetical protein GCM10010109_92650 [Actinoplanes campanulatus]GID36316.1 hypothetical protein Aca09nite_28220 [Actinoplanes campanulatus]
MNAGVTAQTITAPAEVDERQPPTELFRHLRSTPHGVRSREAARRSTVYGPNELSRRQVGRWPRQLLAQFTQPLAVLLMVAAVLAWFGHAPALGLAVVGVILLNAAFAFVQERQAECSAAPPARQGRPARWSPTPVCEPRSAGSPPCRSAGTPN